MGLYVSLHRHTFYLIFLLFLWLAMSSIEQKSFAVSPFHPDRVENPTFLLMLRFLILSSSFLSLLPPISLLFFLSLCPLLNKCPLIFHSQILSLIVHCGWGGPLNWIRGVISAPLKCEAVTPRVNVPRQPLWVRLTRHGKHRRAGENTHG